MTKRQRDFGEPDPARVRLLDVLLLILALLAAPAAFAIVYLGARIAGGP